MGLNRAVLIRLADVLGAQDVRRIEDNARVAEAIEQRWKARADAMFAELLDDLLDTIEEHGEVRWHHDLLERIGALLLEHELQTTVAAANTIAPAEYVKASHDVAAARLAGIGKGRATTWEPSRWPEAVAFGALPEARIHQQVKRGPVLWEFTNHLGAKLFVSVDFRTGAHTTVGDPRAEASNEKAEQRAARKSATPADLVGMKAYPTSPETVGRDGSRREIDREHSLYHYWSSKTGPLCGRVLEDNLLLDGTLAQDVATCPSCLARAKEIAEREAKPDEAAPPSKPPAPPTPPPSDGGPRKPRWPTDLVRVRQLWDQWRRTGKLPGRTAQQAAAIKTLYIRRVQQAWQRYGREFIAGAPRVVGKHTAPDVNQSGDGKNAPAWNTAAFDRAGAKAMLEKALAVPRARAATVIETETTRYYNTVRINTYNTIDSVVAYLFVAVRDSATTKWCRSRAGVIFFKGSEGVKGLAHNTPPCHYNCRSELLPLSRLNPAHRRLLEDKRLWADNRKLEPLLPEWNQHKAA